MMATTHAAMGAALTLPLVALAPDLAAGAALAAFLGGLAPDADALVGTHRRTLHHPELYSALAVAAVAVAALAPGPATVGVAAALVGAAVHVVSEVFGGGLAVRPWERDDDRGVYLHSRRRWVAPRRWVRYDGAPEDFLVGLAFAAPVAVVHGGTVRTLVLAGVAASVSYTLLRRPLTERYPSLFES